MVLRPPNTAPFPSAGRPTALLVALLTALTIGLGPRGAQARGQLAAVGTAAPDEALPDITEVPDAKSDDPMLAQAMDAYKRGTSNFNAGNFETALSDFKEAASLYASADFQYNIARCYEELGKHQDAMLAYQTYLKAKPNAEDRAPVETRIKLLEKLVDEERKRKAQQDARGPTVVVVDEGQAKAEKRQKLSRPLILSGAVITGIGAAVAIGGGLGFGIAAKRRSDDLDAIQTGGNPDNATFAQAQDLADEGQRLETLQIAAAAAGAGVAVIGAVLLGVGFSFKRSSAKSSPQPPAQALLVPRWGPGQAGLGLVGRF